MVAVVVVLVDLVLVQLLLETVVVAVVEVRRHRRTWSPYHRILQGMSVSIPACRCGVIPRRRRRRKRHTKNGRIVVIIVTGQCCRPVPGVRALS